MGLCHIISVRCSFRSLPLGGRVITVSSTAGVLKGKSDTTLRFLADHATVADIDALATEFVAAAAKGEHKDKGFSGSAYSVSKSCATYVPPHSLAELSTTAVIIVHCCCCECLFFLLFAVCCLLFAVCCLLFAVACLLLLVLSGWVDV